MNRRAFSRQIGSRLSAVFALARTSRAAASRTENKQWAHEHLKGMENTLRPSFSPDFKSLDEDGIRWRIQLLVEAIYDLQAPLLLHGSHPWVHMKYHWWCLLVLDAATRDLIRNNYRKTGITPVDRPEEEFIVGRTNYARGVRVANLASTPLYS